MVCSSLRSLLEYGNIFRVEGDRLVERRLHTLPWEGFDAGEVLRDFFLEGHN